MDLTHYIRNVPDFPKPGIMFKDITPLLKSPEAFRETIRLLAERYRTRNVSKVVGIESRGFIFAAALAYELRCGMVPVRKLGKLPADTVQQTYDLEYGTSCIEVHTDAISKGERILVLDDVIATGGTLGAACLLVQKLGGEIIEVATVIELTFLSGREKVCDLPFFSMIQY